MIVLYTDYDYETEYTEVPDFSGLSLWQVNQLAVNRGLNIRISGSSYGDSDIMAYQQDYDPGDEVEMGTFVTVWFHSPDEE